MSELVLVTGATGAVGPAVVAAFREAGLRVRAFSFHPPDNSLFSSDIEVLRGDVRDSMSVDRALDGVNAVVHMAGLVHINNPGTELRRRYQEINVAGTKVVAEQSAARGVKRFILFSTINVYESIRGRTATEDTPVKPDTTYAQTKLEAERLVMELNREGSWIGTVLRLGTVYGARVRGNYQKLPQALGRGRFLPFAGTNRRTLVYDRDVGRAVVAVLQSPTAAGKVYNVTDGSIHTVQDIFRAICSALGRPAPRFFLPTGPLRLASAAAKRVTDVLRVPPPTPLVLLEKYFEDIAVDGSKIQRETSFRPEYDLQRGWQEAVRLMRQAGEL